LPIAQTRIRIAFEFAFGEERPEPSLNDLHPTDCHIVRKKVNGESPKSELVFVEVLHHAPNVLHTRAKFFGQIH
jgi:hypothetical protein